MTGDEVVRYRHLLGMTQAQFAALVMVTQPSVSQWETGKTSPTKVQAELIRMKVAEHQRTAAEAVPA